MLFRGNTNMSSTSIMLQVTSPFLGMFREKIWPGPEKSKNVPKTAKIEGYNTRFRTFPLTGIRAARGTFEGHGMSLERSQVAWNDYMDAFTFILRQFWVSLEINKCSVQTLFEAMQMVRNTRATLQVMLTFLGTFKKIWPCPENSKNVSKTANFGGHWKWVMWLGKNMWMPLCLFRNNFKFHEKWINGGVERLFEATQMMPNTRATLQVTSAFLGTFWEENMVKLGEMQTCLKNNQNWRL